MSAYNFSSSQERKLSTVFEHLNETNSSLHTSRNLDIDFKSVNELNEGDKVKYEGIKNGDTQVTSGITNSFESESLRDDSKPLENEEKTENQLNRSIKSRHLLMISLGTGIGTGLLVGNGQVLAKSGPAGLVIGYGVASIMVYFIVQAAGELGICYSGLTGNYIRYPSILVDPALGFAISIIYTLQWLTVMPLQLVTAAMTIGYWTNINPNIFVAIVLVIVVLTNCFGAKGYVEAEFLCNIFKVLMMVGFVLLAILINTGAIGTDGYIGTIYWKNPGAFANGFKGVCSVFCYAAFSYGGIEVLALTAAEQENPIKAIPSACKKTVYRILFLYMLTTILIGFLVPYDSPQLMGSTSGGGSHSSPFVIAIASHGVKVVPHLINAVILISIVSVANSAFYSSTRLLLSLSEQGKIPKIFNYVDKEGRPWYCILFASLFGSIGFVASSPYKEEVFTWLLAISGLSQIFLWMSICLSHIRFRRAMIKQGKSLDEIGYKAPTGCWGSWIALSIALFSLISQFWVAIAPIGKDGKLDVLVFFQNYLAAPIVLIAYLGYKTYYKDWRLYIPSDKIDLSYGREIYVPEEQVIVESPPSSIAMNSVIITKSKE
ncbi:hypothetical protein Kpol_1052p14 [Vanderwaltozyma polyspora DSM 70294]|uniref:Amino acid permease/ SLC12A domain-containing protein n=1 Tax=Vanderwaltozyma polyspora (strain ATCC 22028 / DSM 70294 / BCRC 21397 / CBS 2163 / NBRC 10782 / NRRL Y-8283 / UCD 57-17) TaxID=436907 RepID=A7TM26_VANPO|nr:uncharacterized protein Kpol_1052p14 [Vanderwaltozyma polyspora DSM 70294]EDO16668.1 hypothetical protein Kpol_1052p14 [Vanderwaltozyma polyspora DSM 70294]